MSADMNNQPTHKKTDKERFENLVGLIGMEEAKATMPHYVKQMEKEAKEKTEDQLREENKALLDSANFNKQKFINAYLKRKDVEWGIRDGKVFLQGVYEVIGRAEYKYGIGLAFKENCGRKGGPIYVDKLADVEVKKLVEKLELVSSKALDKANKSAVYQEQQQQKQKLDETLKQAGYTGRHDPRLGDELKNTDPLTFIRMTEEGEDGDGAAMIV